MRVSPRRRCVSKALSTQPSVTDTAVLFTGDQTAHAVSDASALIVVRKALAAVKTVVIKAAIGRPPLRVEVDRGPK